MGLVSQCCILNLGGNIPAPPDIRQNARTVAEANNYPGSIGQVSSGDRLRGKARKRVQRLLGRSSGPGKGACSKHLSQDARQSDRRVCAVSYEGMAALQQVQNDDKRRPNQAEQFGGRERPRYQPAEYRARISNRGVHQKGASRFGLVPPDRADSRLGQGDGILRGTAVGSSGRHVSRRMRLGRFDRVQADQLRGESGWKRLSIQHQIRYVQAKVRHRQSAHVLGPRRVFVSRFGTQQYETSKRGFGYDSLSLLLSLARGRRLHALLHLPRHADAQVDQRVQQVRSVYEERRCTGHRETLALLRDADRQVYSGRVGVVTVEIKVKVKGAIGKLRSADLSPPSSNYRSLNVVSVTGSDAHWL